MDTESSKPDYHNLFITRTRKLGKRQRVSKITSFIDPKITKGLLSLFVVGIVVFCFNSIATAYTPGNGDVVIKLIDQFDNVVIGGTITLKTVGMAKGTIAVDGWLNDMDGNRDGTITIGSATLIEEGAQDGNAWLYATSTSAGYISTQAVITGTQTLGAGTYSLANVNYGTASFEFAFKISATDELGQWIYLSSDATSTLTLSSGLTEGTHTYRDGYLYLAATGTGYATLTVSGYVATSTTLTYEYGTTTQTSATVTLPFALKVIVRDELGNGLAYTDLSVKTFRGVGPSTYTVTAGTTTLYWADTMGTAATLSILKSGFIYSNKTHPGLEAAITGISSGQIVIDLGGDNATKTIRSTAISTPGIYSIKGLEFALKVYLCDELGNPLSGGTVTYRGGTPTYSSKGTQSNEYYFTPSPGNDSLTASKMGYRNLKITGDGDTGFNTNVTNGVTVDANTQTIIILSGIIPRNTEVPAGTIATGSGLWFNLKVLGVTDELGNTLTLTSGCFDTVAGGFGIATQTISGNVGYIAGSPTIQGTLSITLNGYVKGYIRVTPATSSQQTLAWDTGNKFTANIESLSLIHI